MPAYRFSRSFSNLNLSADSNLPQRPSTSLGHSSLTTAGAVRDLGGPAATHSKLAPPSRRSRPPLLSLFRKPSFVSWGRSSPSVISPTYSTVSTSSFGSLGPRRRSSSETGAAQLRPTPNNARLSRLAPRSFVSLHRLSVDADPFAALPSPTTPLSPSITARGPVQLDGPAEGRRWLDEVALEQVAGFEGELTCALRDVGNTPKRVGDATDHPIFDLKVSTPASPAQPWYLLGPTPATTPSISVTPPAEVALHLSRFAAAQEALLSSVAAATAPIINNAETAEDEDSGDDDEMLSSSSHYSSEAGDRTLRPDVSTLALPATPLPAGLQYARHPVSSTPRNSLVDGDDLGTDLTPLLASLLAFGENEGRDLLDPVAIDWSSSSDYDTANEDTDDFEILYDDDNDDDHSAMDVDSSPLTPATPLTPRERLGRFTRARGLSPSPGRVGYARAALCVVKGDFGNVQRRSELINRSTRPPTVVDTPTPPLRIIKRMPPAPAIKPHVRANRPAALLSTPPTKGRLSHVAIDVAPGKENTPDEADRAAKVAAASRDVRRPRRGDSAGRLLTPLR